MRRTLCLLAVLLAATAMPAAAQRGAGASVRASATVVDPVDARYGSPGSDADRLPVHAAGGIRTVVSTRDASGAVRACPPSPMERAGAWTRAAARPDGIERRCALPTVRTAGATPREMVVTVAAHA